MDENNEYFKCFRVLYHVMKICGIFPFLFSHKGTSKYLYISRIITFFSVICFVPLYVQQCYVIKNAFLKLTNFRFDTFVRVLPPVSGRISFLFIPFLTWRSHKQIYIHLEKWQKLQESLSNIQKTAYLSPMRCILPSINIIILTVTLFVLIPLKPYFDLNTAVSTSIPSFIYLAVAFFSIILYWISDCLFVIFVAKNILILIQNSIASNNGENFIRLVKFWVDLYDWNAEFCSTISIMFLIVVSNIVVMLVACFYTLTFLIVVEEDKVAGLAYFIFASSCFVMLLVFCESANFLVNQMATVIRETVLSSNTSGMELKLLAVMLALLQTIEARKPKIMVNGVMIINRSSILSIFATVINFLIVLKQFNTEG